MYGFLIGIHVIICLALIITVLLQSSKGEGLAGAFGGSGITGAVFGGRGAATFLSKATTYVAIAFFLSCIGLSFITPGSSQRATESAIKKEAQKQSAQPPATTPETSTQPPIDVGEGQNVETTTPTEGESKLPPVPQEKQKKQESQDKK